MKPYFTLLPGHRFIFATLLLAAMLNGQVQAQETTDKALAAIVINGNRYGDSELLIGVDGSFLIPSELLSKVLDGIAKPEIITALTGQKSFVAIESLATFKITTLFNLDSLVLSIEVPPSAMPPVDLSAIHERLPPAGLLLQPEKFSALLGLSLNLDQSWNNSPQDSTAKTSGSLDLHPVVNVFGWVVEGIAETGWDESPYARFDSARIVKDFQGGLARMTAGFIETQARSFQSTLPVYGAAIHREDTLMGDRKPKAEILEEFVLEQSADVVITLNGITIKRIRLRPGTYRLSDLPLAAGINDVSIEILESGKAKRVLRLSLPWDGELLPKGEFDWYAGLGVDRNDLKQPFGTAFASYGLSRALTLGLDMQAGFGTILGGTQAHWASPIGALSAGAALDWSYEDPLAYGMPLKALRFSWNFSLPGLRFAPHFGFSTEYREACFSSPEPNGTIAPDSGYDTLFITIQLSQSLPGGGAFVGLGSSYFENGTWGKRALSVGFQQPLPGSASISVSVGADYQPGSAIEPSLSVSMSVSPPDRRILQFRKDLITGTDGIDLSIPLGSSTEAGISARGEGFIGAPGTPLTSSLSLSGPAGFLDAAVGAAYQKEPSIAFEKFGINGGASTTLAFAGGHFGLTRNINDSFAFLVPDASAGRERVVALTGVYNPIATSHAGHASLISNVPSYKGTAVSIEMPESAPEIAPSVHAVLLRPTYRSGTVINVSLKRNIMVRGRLMGQNGKPLAGTLGDLKTITGEPLGIATFTDGEGVFELYGLEPGRYEVAWENGTLTVFSLAETTLNEIDLGTTVPIPGASAASESGMDYGRIEP